MTQQTQTEAVAALAAVDLLLRHAQERIRPNLTTQGDPYERSILLVLFARSVPLTEAIVRLGEGGFGREALILNRPLFELLLDAHWTDANPELSEQRFLEHARFTMHLQRETASYYPELFGEMASKDRLDDDELKRHLKTFGSFGGKGWTGLSTHGRVKAIEDRFDDDDRRQLRIMSEVLNGLSNAELHPSASSLARALRRVPTADGGEKLQVRVGSEPELVSVALRQTWWIFGQLLGIIHTATALPTKPLLDAGDAGEALIDAAEGEAS
jgi:Family of unknown function (DUF5677)